MRSRNVQESDNHPNSEKKRRCFCRVMEEGREYILLDKGGQVFLYARPKWETEAAPGKRRLLSVLQGVVKARVTTELSD